MLLIQFFPAGIINFEQFEGRTILIAQNEGTANCTTTFKLKMGNKFTEKSICFGVNETRGNYKLIKDTIYFSDIKLGRGREEYYEFAVINKTDDKHILIRYRNSNDTIGVPITIIKSNI
ncbi:MAG: hypothetical protein RBR79_00265 [Bacteroidales bacterium]|jgi:hypothetical protein|nr:hypothetical protein [Bacteroidales bacterium]